MSIKKYALLAVVAYFGYNTFVHPDSRAALIAHEWYDLVGNALENVAEIPLKAIPPAKSAECGDTCSKVPDSGSDQIRKMASDLGDKLAFDTARGTLNGLSIPVPKAPTSKSAEREFHFNQYNGR